MTRTLTLYGTAILALGLSACSPSGEPVDKPTPETTEVQDSGRADIAVYQALASEQFVDSRGQEADLTGLVAALPAFVSLSWDEQSFDADSGATVFTGLDLQVTGDNPFGLKIDQAAFWGLETELLAARLGGERLDDSGALFTRLEADGLNYYGLAEAITGFFTGIIAQMPDTEEFADGLFVVDQLDITADRMVMTGASLRPWEYTAVPETLLDELDDEEAEAFLLPALHFGQQAIAFNRAIAYDQAVAQNVTSVFAMKQPGSEAAGTSRVELYGLRGANGFDLEHTVSVNMTTEQSTLYTEIAMDSGNFEEAMMQNPFAGTSFTQTGKLDYSVGTDLRLDKVMGFLARGELPSMGEKDLMSLGTWAMEGYSVALDDQQIFSAAKADLDMSGWTWLIPTDINYSLDDATIGLSNFGRFGMGLVPSEVAESDEEAALVLEGIDRAIELLPDYDLDEITFDATGDMTWSDATGDTAASFRVFSEGNGEGLFSLAIDLPVYDAIVTAARADDDDKEAAFEEAFTSAFAFKSLVASEEDLGGYDRLLGFAQAIGKEYPNEGWGAMIGNMEPAQMRSYLATIIRMAKPEIEREVPQAGEWVEAMALFYETGGKIEFRVQPDQPLTIEMLESFDAEDDPQVVLDLMNASVTHTPK